MLLTQGNIAIVRRAYDAFRAGDVDALKSMTTPDFVLHASSATDGEVHHGPEAMGEILQAINDRWEDFRLEPLEFYDGGDCVLVLGTILTRGKDEAGIASTAGQVWTLRDGKVASLKAYLDSEDAIRASGLTSLLT